MGAVLSGTGGGPHGEERQRNGYEDYLALNLLDQPPRSAIRSLITQAAQDFSGYNRFIVRLGSMASAV